jgi:hypothetical protein
MKLEMHRLASEGKSASPQAIMDIMDWCVETVVPSFKECGMVPRPKRRAAEGEGCPDHKGVLAYEVVDKVMTLLGDMIMVGLTGVAMEMKIATFTDVVGTGIVCVYVHVSTLCFVE